MKKIVTVFIMLILFSCSSPRSKENADNLVRVNVTMRMSEVRSIMGEPDKVVIMPQKDQEYDFVYSAPSGYGDDFHIFFNRQDSTVLRIAKGDY